MTSEELREIHNTTRKSFLDLGLSSSELKEHLLKFIVEREKICAQDYMQARAKISAALSLITDDDTRIKLDRKLKDQKISYKNENLLDKDGNAVKELPLSAAEGKAVKKSDSPDKIWKSAVLACKKIPGFDSLKILGLLKSKYPFLNLEMIDEVIK